MLQRLGVGSGRAGERAQALGFGREPEAVGGLGVVERLDAEPVPGSEDLLGFGVPDHEREHAAQLANPVGTVVVVTGDDHLAVARGAEGRMIIADQPSPQFDEVVDLAVEDHRVALGVLRWSPTQRLAGALDVDDAEPVESQRDPVVVPDGGVVGAAVPRAGHAFGDLLDLLVTQASCRDERHQAAHCRSHRPVEGCLFRT